MQTSTYINVLNWVSENNKLWFEAIGVDTNTYGDEEAGRPRPFQLDDTRYPTLANIIDLCLTSGILHSLRPK